MVRQLEKDIVHQPLSDQQSKEAVWGSEPWKGESQFRLRPRRAIPVQVPAETGVPRVDPVDEKPEQVCESETSEPSKPAESSRHDVGEPYSRPVAEPYWQSSGYGPVRVRQHVKNPPTFLIRPVETQVEDLQDIKTQSLSGRQCIGVEQEPEDRRREFLSFD